MKLVNMDISKNITRKSNIPGFDSLSSYKEFTAQQHHNVYQIFYDFIADVKPARILEIGTALGGFTQFLKHCCDTLNISTEIVTYDIYARQGYDDMRQTGIDVRIENVFTDDGEGIIEPIIELVKNQGTTIVLCDGGCKAREFNFLSKHIKSGDYILAHDYCESEEIFDKEIKDKIWQWHELKKVDVENAFLQNNLTEYKQDKFKQAVWLCAVKG